MTVCQTGHCRLISFPLEGYIDGALSVSLCGFILNGYASSPKLFSPSSVEYIVDVFLENSFPMRDLLGGNW